MVLKRSFPRSFCDLLIFYIPLDHFSKKIQNQNDEKIRYFQPKSQDLSNFPDIFAFCRQVHHLWRVPKIKIIDKRPRESTDLEEYVVLVPKNIAELQAVAKLSPCGRYEKSALPEVQNRKNPRIRWAGVL